MSIAACAAQCVTRFFAVVSNDCHCLTDATPMQISNARCELSTDWIYDNRHSGVVRGMRSGLQTEDDYASINIAPDMWHDVNAKQWNTLREARLSMHSLSRDSSRPYYVFHTENGNVVGSGVNHVSENYRVIIPKPPTSYESTKQRGNVFVPFNNSEIVDPSTFG